VTSDQPALFSVAPAISSGGTLSFTPAPGANGNAVLTIRVHDTGGTSSGGIDTSAPQTATVAVLAVNDPPSFVKGADQIAVEDAGQQMLAGWATLISAGPPDEAGQSLAFLASADNAALFSAGPTIGFDGTLTYTPAPDANGTATVTVCLQDGGGTAAGGNDTSAPQVFTIAIASVNDAPAFAKGSNESTRQNAGPQSIAGWATGMRAGPADEAGQALDFIVTPDKPELFSAQPAVSRDGTLSFTPAPNVTGSATVTVVLRDDGGTALGGMDRSTPQSFTITTGFVNDAPSFAAGPSLEIAQDGGPQNVPGWATKISAGPDDEASQHLDFRVSVDRPELFATPPALSTDGSLTYAPALKGSGTATITVRLHDDGGTADGGIDLSEPQSFTIAVTSFAEEIGTYNGLVRAADGGPLEAARVGMFRISLGKGGGFSGRLVLGGTSATFRGHLDQAGTPHFGLASTDSFTFRRPGLPPLFFTFKVDTANGSDTVSGTIHDGLAPFAVFTADRALYTARRNPAPPLRSFPPGLIGSYTVIFAAQEPEQQRMSSSGFPQGDGSGVAVVNSNGSMRLTGTLADGTRVSYGNVLSKAQVWPLYDGDAKGKAITGPVTFRDISGVSDFDGHGLLWFQPAGKGTMYPGGWPQGIRTDLIGARYRHPHRSPVISNLSPANGDGNATLTLTEAGLPAEGLLQPLNIGNDSRVEILGPNPSDVTFALDPRTGLFKGRFMDSVTHDAVKFNGAVIQKQNLGAGAFRTPTGVGAASLTPK
jgi:hypothetical protein